MTSKRTESSQQTQSQPPKLTISRLEADKQLSSRIDLGKQLLSIAIPSIDVYKEVKHKHQLWHEYNKELLRRMFDSDELSKEYSFWGASFLPSFQSSRPN